MIPTTEHAGCKVFLADARPGRPHNDLAVAARAAPHIRILLSYHYYGKEDLDVFIPKYFRPPYPEVFIDSGAFSAATQGTQIDLRAYAAFLLRYAHWITTYANLDAIGNAAVTRDNQCRLEDMGLRPLPVFHVAEPWSYLEGYLDQYPYIALGGMVPWRTAPKRLWPWLVKCFQLARSPDKTTRAVYHGFGVTTWQFLAGLPWYSVDSSTWGASFRYGRVPVWDERTSRFLEARLGDHASCYHHARAIRALGFDPADFAVRARNDRAKICALAALSYMAAETWLQKRHGLITIPGHQGAAPGVRLHLVDASRYALSWADAGVKANQRTRDDRHE